MHASTLFAVSALAAVASAQTAANGGQATSTVSQAMPPAATQGFQIGSVLQSDKSAWCRSELNTCPMICGGSAQRNLCDPNTLEFDCVCRNGTQPDTTAFTGTIPFFICQANFAQCIQAHANDADGQATCTANKVCGSRNASEAVETTSSAAASTAASTRAASSSQTASPSASATGSSSSGNAATSVNIELATSAFAGLLVAGFAFLL